MNPERSMTSRRWMGGGVVAAVLMAGTAHADTRAADTATAIQLYDDAEKLTKAGNYAAACPKLAESQRLDPQLGTLLHLAACFEKVGQTASAWGSFADAADLAARLGDPREKIARERATALGPKLSKLTITVADASIAGLEVRRDGVLVGKAQWGFPVATDPGHHTVTATAAGKKPWSKAIDVGPLAAQATLAVPALEDAPVASSDEAPPRRGWQRPVGLVVGGVGLATIAVGGFLGLGAKSKFDDSSGHCDATGCDAEGLTMRRDAVDAGNLATIVVGAGAVTAVVGTVLWLTAPHAARPSTARSRAPQIGFGPRGVTVGGAW
jgi:hypothetical protein